MSTLRRFGAGRSLGEFEQLNLVTRFGHIRHPVNFKGLREDKKPKDVVPDLV